MDVFLIVVAVLVPLLTLLFSFYVLVYYQHPDDKWSDYFPKVVVVLGLSLAILSVLALPFDVANGGVDVGCDSWNTNCGGLDLAWLWPTVYLLIAIFIIVLIPFTIVFYESWEPGANCCKRICTATICQVIGLVCWVLAIGICFSFFKFVDIPVATYSSTVGEFLPCSVNTQGSASVYSCDNSDIFSSFPVREEEHVEIEATFVIYLIGFLSFVSWIFFSVYTGIGLATLPMSLWRSFYYRPKFMPRELYLKLRAEMAKKAADLMEQGSKLRKETSEKPGVARVPLSYTSWKRKTDEKKAFNQFKQEVDALETDFEDLRYCHENWKGYNPLVPYCKLILGIISFILTLVWVLHIILYMLVRNPYPNGIPISYFLNTAFSWASKEINFALLGVILVGTFAIYLLFCALEGTARLGLRFLIVEIHPLKVGGTYMNSLLFNLSLVLLCVPALVQFCTVAFADYIVLTNAALTFNVFVQNMRFFNYFFEYNIFVFVLLGVMVLAAVFTYCCLRDKNKKTSAGLREKIDRFKEKGQIDEKEKNGKVKKTEATDQPNKQRAEGEAESSDEEVEIIKS